MRAFEIQQTFGLDALTLCERPDPAPGPGEVMIRVLAASLNYRDLLMVQGHYNPKQPLPLIPLSDGVGIVESVGPGVSRVKVGDRVAGVFAQTWIAGDPPADVRSFTLGGPIDGMLAEKAVLTEMGAIMVPEHLTDEQAATLPCAGVTAWSALVELGALRAGDTVLLQGTGGVSIFALQFAKLAGARTIITSSSDEKLERCRRLGADETINYVATPDWDGVVRDMTEGRGVDHVVEVGGAGTFGRSLRAVRIGGRISVIGILSGVQAPAELTAILMRRVAVQGIFVGSRATFEAMIRAVDHGKLAPVVDQVFPFEDARSAFDAMRSAKHFGKIVIRVAS
ncbi:MAG TPA: NAD(P)-dependent alcohol dehydrogenase [Phycisphaerae bacterium]|nr:NAD(P)-dependent alcohol dehydrogenase [Phycisphaerae bacterium]HRW55778.1 NAD(P)-dependent alcohol dehydrogenase [Phycisphaerae bacterium]